MSKIIWMLSANYCPFVDSAFGKNSFYFSFRWKKDARNFQSMCFENLPPLEELFGELIDNMLLKIYQRFLTKMWNSYFYNSMKDMPIKKTCMILNWLKRTYSIILSYNLHPQFQLYWSTEEVISCPIKRLMSRNRFVSIKLNIHVW